MHTMHQTCACDAANCISNAPYEPPLSVVLRQIGAVAAGEFEETPMWLEAVQAEYRMGWLQLFALAARRWLKPEGRLLRQQRLSPSGCAALAGTQQAGGPESLPLLAAWSSGGATSLLRKPQQ